MKKAYEAFPGVFFCALLATAAVLLADLAFVKEQLRVGALLLVILFGMAIRSCLPIPESWTPGITFAQKPLLRIAVAGLGFKLSLTELAKVGGPALAVVVATTIFALILGFWVAKWMGVDRKLGVLMSVGGAICGASAIVAADSVVQSEKSETASALGTITLLGTLGILAYPILGRALGLDDFTYALWNGASIHELAQVVAAGQSFSPDSTDLSTVVKLARITLLAPIVMYLAWDWRRKGLGEQQANAPIVPWFLVAFLAIVVLNSMLAIPKDQLGMINRGVLWLLCVGMAGVGLNSGFQDVKAHGAKPVWVGTIQWIALAIVSLGLSILVGRAV